MKNENRIRKEIGVPHPTSPTAKQELDWTWVQRWLAQAAVSGGRQGTVGPVNAAEIRSWLDQQTERDIALIRMYAVGLSWKRICAHLGISRATANRHLQYLLTVIAWRLNGREIPTRWSRRYLLDRERELSSDEQRGHVECVRHLRVGQPHRAASSIGPVGRIEHEDASTSRRRGEPPDSEAAAEDSGP